MQRPKPLSTTQLQITIGPQSESDLDHTTIAQRLAGGLVDGHGMKQYLSGGPCLVTPEASEDQRILTQGLSRSGWQVILVMQVTGNKTFKRLARLPVEEVETFHRSPPDENPCPKQG